MSVKPPGDGAHAASVPGKSTSATPDASICLTSPLCRLPNRFRFANGLHFKLHAPLAHGLVAIRAERNGSHATETLPYRMKDTASRMKQETVVSANSARLEALL